MSAKTGQELGLEPPREVEGKSILIVGLRARPKSGADIPELWQRLMTQKIPKSLSSVEMLVRRKSERSDRRKP